MYPVFSGFDEAWWAIFAFIFGRKYSVIKVIDDNILSIK